MSSIKGIRKTYISNNLYKFANNKKLRIMNTTPSMTFAEALANVFNTTKAYSNYRGRARRSEFWYTTLICTIMSLAVDGIGYLVESAWEINGFVRPMFTVVSAYFLIANYSCLCRRPLSRLCSPKTQ